MPLLFHLGQEEVRRLLAQALLLLLSAVGSEEGVLDETQTAQVPAWSAACLSTAAERLRHAQPAQFEKPNADTHTHTHVVHGSAQHALFGGCDQSGVAGTSSRSAQARTAIACVEATPPQRQNDPQPMDSNTRRA